MRIQARKQAAFSILSQIIELFFGDKKMNIYICPEI
jgi:hypothetical protein